MTRDAEVSGFALARRARSAREVEMHENPAEQRGERGRKDPEELARFLVAATLDTPRRSRARCLHSAFNLQPLFVFFFSFFFSYGSTTTVVGACLVMTPNSMRIITPLHLVALHGCLLLRLLRTQTVARCSPRVSAVSLNYQPSRLDNY